MKAIQPELERYGVAVVAISFTEPAIAKRFLDIHPVPFPVVTDPERTAYRVLGLGRTTWGTIFHWRSLLAYLHLMLRGWLPKKPIKHDDLLQLGGDFILDGEGKLIFAYASRDATDRPSPRDLLTAMASLPLVRP